MMPSSVSSRSTCGPFPASLAAAMLPPSSAAAAMASAAAEAAIAFSSLALYTTFRWSMIPDATSARF